MKIKLKVKRQYQMGLLFAQNFAEIGGNVVKFDLNIESAFLVAHIMKVKKLEVCYYGNSKSRTQ